jgi:hypothetical protein
MDDAEDRSRDEDRPGTREELRVLLEEAGLGPNQTRVWLDHPTAYLSGLVPAIAITNPATAARARRATARLIARLGDKVPDLVNVIAVRILQPGTHRIELTFAWDEGTAVRVIDLQPYLWGPAFEQIRADYATFAQLRVDGGALSWPGGADLSPAFLYAESWSPDTPGARTFSEDEGR